MKLTKEMIANVMPHSIIALGLTLDSPEGLHMMGTGKVMRYVIVSGGIGDWTLYCYWNTQDNQWIKDHGDKPLKSTCKNIIEADKEVWDLFRI